MPHLTRARPVLRSLSRRLSAGCCDGGGGVISGGDPVLWSQLPAPPLRHRYFALRHGQSKANVSGTISSDPAVATLVHGLTELGREQAAGAAGAVSGRGSSGAARAEGLTHLMVYSSDFTRAWETAEIFASGVRSEWASSGKTVVGPTAELRLRERWFGEFDATPDCPEAEGSLGGYDAVWARDRVDATHKSRGVESVAEVVGRASAFVAELEALAGPPLLGSARGWRGCDRTRRADAATAAATAAAEAAAAAAAGAEGDGAASEPEERWGVVLVAHGDVLQILQTAFEELAPGQHRSLPHLPNAELRLLNELPNC